MTDSKAAQHAMTKPLRIADCPICTPPSPVTGQLVTVEDELFYRIANYDQLRPFFMTLVSASDQWMLLSSTGGLTAGRRNPDLALFPYDTDDKLEDAAEITGSKTLLIVQDEIEQRLWEPLDRKSTRLNSSHI